MEAAKRRFYMGQQSLVLFTCLGYGIWGRVTSLFSPKINKQSTDKINNTTIQAHLNQPKPCGNVI